MIKSIKKGFLSVLGILALLIAVVVIENYREATLRDRKYDSPTLTAKDKRNIREALILKQTLGDKIWPHLSKANIPIILFNDQYEFLTNHSTPPDNWSPVKKDRIDHSIYYRKTVDKPQNFVVKVDDKWAGSLATFDRLNREYYLGVRKELPPFIAQLYPYQYASVSTDLYIVTLLNEIFHAYQAEFYSKQFNQATESLKYGSYYPYVDPNTTKLWNKEGYYLWKASHSENPDTIISNTKKFLTIREERRKQANLSPQLIRYEQNMEWLDGLAKYSEIKFYELSARQSPASSLVYFHINHPQWKQEYSDLKNKLGHQKDEFRFHLSGMAQAEILDKLLPNWKVTLSIQQESLEDLLRLALNS
ncbi:MAG TPA: hypothetical protein VKA34_03035 [Balneolales bacterium]|nr:hypothetical protein [Balneolales bacterium]